MAVWQALLIAVWAGYCSFDDQGPQMLRRPLLVGPIVGIILGDVKTGLIISATLELMWMGLGNMAGYKTPDMIIGTIVGTTISITSTGATAEGIAAGVAAATTVAVLSQQLLLIFDFVRQFFAVWADRLALTGEFDSILMVNYVAIAFQFLLRAVPTFLVVYFSAGVVDKILNVIPSNILKGLSTASGILPAVGLSILMTMMMKGFMWPFLIFGFVASTYLGLGILPVTLISLAFAMLYSVMMEIKDRQNETPVAVSGRGDDEDGGYDL
ncbi:MAG: PTS mannose/fructose/sorbose/N-acetylgalactosamine transporter subunit IIC [Lacrimispora sphenoides]|jgi:PTS system mannose-specific IIC component|uniref:PTS mannose/fructose/sorbose/N-acetylgalactosamine transporter subunit IIC n=1 Tax=Lacrimispora sphenoides TaxID=29370 RepID=UPI0008D66F4E|nr:PTS sugar transporter subunit IIC [Lacrimispora sphenoides]SEU33707.1 PTS system, mannose-specific IIC component [Lacrimispora sphenoides]